MIVIKFSQIQQQNPIMPTVTVSSNSSVRNSSVSSSDLNLATVATELGVAGTLATIATQTTVMGIGHVVVATVGASALTVSLPAVVAVGAAGCLGVSLGKKLVNAINSVNQ